MTSSGVNKGDKYRPILGEGDEKNTVWRFGGPPNYDVVNKLFEEGRTKVWPPGSIEETVQNLVKSWEMEIFHKTRVEDMKTMLPGFTYSLNGRKALSMDDIKEIGGGYNPHLQTSLPEHLRIYNPATENFESSHRAFIETFPRGFAIELVRLYCGPPEIVFKFRHWGFMEGPFKGHAPTRKIVELFGIAILPVDEKMKLKRVEFFFDSGELLGKLVEGERIEKQVGDDEALKCPVLRNTCPTSLLPKPNSQPKSK